MSIIASYNPIAFDLSVTGDGASNVITISRNLAGRLFVNDGTVVISGGLPTIANTDLLRVFGGSGADTIGLSEANGALPAAELAGGSGWDLLTGGSNDDTLLGEAGNDTLLGRAGADLLQGGANDDLLAGGDGADVLFGGLGNDRMIWNPGDDSDLMEGDDGIDEVEVNGGAGGEIFTLTANGARVRFDRTDPAPFTLDIGTTERFVLNAGGGDDRFSATGNLAALIGVTVDGGAGDDTLLGGNGADLLIGGEGRDVVDGNQGADLIFLGAGQDVVQWDPGDGSDVIEGQGGTDTLLFNGSNISEIIALEANGGRVRLTRNVGAITLDLADVEAVRLHAVGGSDSVTLGDLSATGLAQVTLDLAGTIGGAIGDGAADTVTLTGRSGADTINLAGSGGTVTITGLAALVSVTQVEGLDSVAILAGGGDDLITVTGLPGSMVNLRIEGGQGNDTLQSTGDGLYLGGAGNDLILAGLTSSSEVIDGGDGTDTLDTRTFNGIYTVNLVTGLTNFGGESFLNFENLITGDGVDTVTGTDAVNVLRTHGGGDTITAGGGNDTVEGGAGADSLDGGDGSDTLAYTSSAAAVTVSLAAGTGTAGDAAGDVFLNFEKVAGSAFADTLAGNAGANTLTGGAGADTMTGGAGDDVYSVTSAADVVIEAVGGGLLDRVFTTASYTLAAGQEVERLLAAFTASTTALTLTGNGFANMIRGNAGANVLNGRGGNDLLQGRAGDDTLTGGAGTDTLIGGAGDDVYSVTSATDVVIEAVGGGLLDRVFTTASYTLAAGQEVERLLAAITAATTALTLTGNGFANMIRGNAGANVLNGAGGSDVLQGMGGADTFRFTTAPGGANIDRIVDYSVAQDRIQLDDAAFAGLAVGGLSAAAFTIGPAATATDDRIIYNSATGALYFDVDGSGAAAAVRFATLAAGLALTAGEFFVI